MMVGMPLHENRWWTYQKERFPLPSYGAMITAFSMSAICLSALLRGISQWPSWSAFGVAFVSILAFFLQLRISDEFKDYEEDSRFRPYRPVPRGLISLSELRRVFMACAVFQAGLALLFEPWLLVLLAIIWLYLGAMHVEFGMGLWLKEHPVVYMLSHMLVMPLIDLYATACEWLPASRPPGHLAIPEGLAWFLAVSFFNGLVFEVGRKIRCQEEEETGVETYSKLWGIRRAVAVWLLVLVCSAACAWVTARHIGFEGPMTGLAGMLFIFSLWKAWRFLQHPGRDSARWIEKASGIWILLVYLGLGTVPMLWTIWTIGGGR